jgi:anti-anti-sigma factor
VDELDAESLLGVEVATAANGTVNIRLAGELDLSNVERLESAVAPRLTARPSRLIVEARELEFADSSAIALWLRWAGEVDHFELRELSPLLRGVLTAMGLDGRLELS